MRLLCISDIHGRQKPLAKILRREPDADLILLAGDLTRHGTPDDVRAIIGAARDHSPHVAAVAGNSDSAEIDAALAEEGVALHGCRRNVKGLELIGLSAVSKGFPWHYRFSESIYSDLLEEATNGHDSVPLLVTHTPPWGMLDLTSLGIRAGSRAVRQWVDRHQPRLVVCGHIHESQGHMRQGGTTVVNCGPAKQHRYATVELTVDSIRVQTHELPKK